MLQQILVEQQNTENQNNNNETFIDRTPNSLSSLMGKPLAKKISITK